MFTFPLFFFFSTSCEIARDTHEIYMIWLLFVFSSRLTFTQMKRKGIEISIAIFAFTNLLVRWWMLFLNSYAIWKTLAIAYQTFSNDFMLSLSHFGAHNIAHYDSQTHADYFAKIQTETTQDFNGKCIKLCWNWMLPFCVYI